MMSDLVRIRIMHFDEDEDQPRSKEIINKYMKNVLDLEQATRELSEPIHQSYTSADGGLAFYKAEAEAATQRGFYSSAESDQIFGRPGDIPSYVRQKERLITELENSPSTESQLWTLWFGFFEIASEHDWQDRDAQDKLLGLLKSILTLPDPPEPKGITKALRRHWIWQSGTFEHDNGLWSGQKVLGIATAETRNDEPREVKSHNDGNPVTASTVRAWANLHGFWARMTIADVRQMWDISEVLDLDAFGSDGLYWKHDMVAYHVRLPSIQAWIYIAGRRMYESARKNTGEELWQPVQVGGDQRQLPWFGVDIDWAESDTKWMTIQRWSFWKDVLASLPSRFPLLTDSAKEVASDILAHMRRVENDFHIT